MNESAFRQPERAGVFHLPAALHPAAEAAAARAGLRTFAGDVSGTVSAPAMLGELGRRFGFPDWFGANFDALDDCLTDPDWAGEAGCAVFVSGLERFAAGHPEEFATLIEVFRAAVDAWRQRNRPFWIVLATGVPGVAPLPAP